MKISDIQRKCLIEATIEPLVAFRRGFARSKAGPFFNLRTVGALVDTGALRVIRQRAGKHYLRISARADA